MDKVVEEITNALQQMNEATARTNGGVEITISETGTLTLKIKGKVIDTGNVDVVGIKPVQEARRRAMIVSNAINKATS